MTSTSKMAAAAVALTVLLGAGSTAFAKAHDQGVADGDIVFPDGTGAAVQTLDQGVSTVVGNGVRGDAASTAGSGNAVNPVVSNEPS